MTRIDVSYDYYYNTFNCGSGEIIPQEKFDRYIEMAWRELIPLCTSDCTEEQESVVKQAVCLIAEEMYVRTLSGGAEREEIDGYSVTYAQKLPLSRVICDIAVRMLGNTGILYAGVEQ